MRRRKSATSSCSPACPTPGFCLRGINKSVLFIEADGAGVVLVDQQIEARGRYPFGLVEHLRVTESVYLVYPRLSLVEFLNSHASSPAFFIGPGVDRHFNPLSRKKAEGAADAKYPA